MDNVLPGETKIGIVGSGRMGVQLVQYFSECGMKVFMKIGDEARIDSIVSKISKNLEKRAVANSAEILSRIDISADYHGFGECGCILETSKEDLDVKISIFQELSGFCSPEQKVFTNTSSLSVTELADHYLYPENVAGFHFFNPVSKMNLVEVIRSRHSSEGTLAYARNLAMQIGKTPILVKDSPGFVVNRLLLPQINDAVRLYELGLATVEDIDAAVKLGLNHPMGPLALADLIGIDVCVAILDEIHKSTGDDHFRPVETLQTMVREGRLGFKTGKGFYEYNRKV